MTSPWQAFLEAYEAKIESAEKALDTGAELDPEFLQPFVPPTNLGPLPEELREYALEVLTRNTGLELRLREAVTTLGQELGVMTRAANGAKRMSPFGEASVPRYLDTSA